MNLFAVNKRIPVINTNYSITINAINIEYSRESRRRRKRYSSGYAGNEVISSVEMHIVLVGSYALQGAVPGAQLLVERRNFSIIYF